MTADLDDDPPSRLPAPPDLARRDRGHRPAEQRPGSIPRTIDALGRRGALGLQLSPHSVRSPEMVSGQRCSPASPRRAYSPRADDSSEKSNRSSIRRLRVTAAFTHCGDAEGARGVCQTGVRVAAGGDPQPVKPTDIPAKLLVQDLDRGVRDVVPAVPNAILKTRRRRLEPKSGKNGARGFSRFGEARPFRRIGRDGVENHALPGRQSIDCLLSSRSARPPEHRLPAVAAVRKRSPTPPWHSPRPGTALRASRRAGACE